MAREKMRSKVKMGGFMCRSPASTAVCVPDDVRSVIAPCRASRRENLLPMGDERNLKYSRLVKANRRENLLPLCEKNDGGKPSADDVFQVVVLRVSLHCQGCAGKVKKHLSRMEGVISYSIDLETKRVIVSGHVSPTGVLESISKVKKAEFWPC